MKRPRVTTDTVQVSRLGCMRRSTLIEQREDRTVEHVELWVEPQGTRPESRTHGAGPASKRRR